MSNQLQVSGEAKIRAIQGPVVANSGVITALDGDASQYVRGDGTLADFPTSTGGGSSVSYYLNSSVSQGTIGGVAYKQLSKVPISGAGTDVSTSANGYIASYITDANDPALLEVPAGNFNCEFYFSVNNNTGNPYVYAELYKYDGTTFTLLGTSVGVPEYITEGTVINPYYFAVPVATSVLTVTDRISIRIYVNVDGRTVTLHTENNHLCQVVTTFSKGLISLNNLTRQNQFFQTGTSGTDFNISSTTATHTFNIPDASATNRGLITTGIQTIAGSKTFSSAITADSGITLKEGVIPSAVGYTGLAGDVDGLVITKRVSSTAYTNLLYFNSATSNTYTFPNLSGTLALLEGTQTFTGVKTFSAATKQDSGVLLKNGTMSALAGYTGIGGGSLNNGIDIILNGGAFTQSLLFQTAAGYSYTFPAATGTIALTSNLSSYVPYTGATSGVDLGIYNLSSNALIVNGTVAAGGSLNLKQNATTVATGIGYNSIGAKTANSLQIYYGGATSLDNKTILFNVTNLTNTSTRTFEFPDASGTIALTSDIPSLANYVTLNGIQTITGGKTFTSDLSVAKIAIANSNTLYTTTGYTTLSASNVGSTSWIGLVWGNGGGNAAVLAFNNSAQFTYTFPSVSGTMALLEETQTFSGSKTFTSLATKVEALGIKLTTGVVSTGGYLTLNTKVVGTLHSLILAPDSATNRAEFTFDNTALRTYALQNANGTIALLSGTQTFTGATTFSSNITVNSVQVGSAGNTTNIKLGDSTFGAITTGSNNIAIGTSALTSITTSNANIGIGNSALASVVDGAFNTGIGFGIGGSITSGSNNALFGYGAGSSITTGNYNTIIGAYAGTAAMANNIVLADGAGNIRYQWDGTNNVFSNPISGTSATFSGKVGIGATPYASTTAIIRAVSATSTNFALIIEDNASNQLFEIKNNGAATFSNSVTTSGKITANGGGLLLDLVGGSDTFSRVTGNRGNGDNLHVSNIEFYNSFSSRLIGEMRGITGTGGTQSNSGQLAFYTNNNGTYAERMRVTSAGDVYIGNSTISTTNTALFFETSTGSSIHVFPYSSGTKTIQEYYRQNGASIGSISYNGTITSYNSTSDYRLKEDLKDYNALNVIDKLKTYDFKWKEAGTRDYGMMAHELQEVLPSYVNGEKDAINKDGSIKPQGVDYSKIVPILVKAIQEQQDIITSLQDRLDKLENK